MNFTKMQGLGNDYLYIWADRVPEDAAELSRRLSDRHFGVGADGMIWMLPSAVADLRMRIFNADGSEGAMCGNGIRCVGKYVYEKGLCPKTALTVETNAGVKTLHLTVEQGVVTSVRVDMGRARVLPPERRTYGGSEWTLLPVDLGNPHAVLFVSGGQTLAPEELGPALQKDPRFPDGVNLELVQPLSKDRLRMRVYERGSGVTLACGTGACASAAAAVASGICKPDEDITLVLDGGELSIRVDRQGNVTMTGPAEFVCEGETFV